MRTYLGLYNVAVLELHEAFHGLHPGIAFLVIAIAVFAPLIVVPLLMRLTIWRDTRAVSLEEMPSFTPTTAPLATIF